MALTITIASPAALLATEFNRLKDLRVIILTRSSREALALLAEGLIHVAGIHLSTREMPNANRLAARDHLEDGFRLLRVAHWQEGIVLAPSSRIRTIHAALQSKLRWIGREQGSGARHCLDELLDQRPHPRCAEAEQNQTGHQRAHDQTSRTVRHHNRSQQRHERAGRAADLHARTAERRDQQSADDRREDTDLRLHS